MIATNNCYPMRRYLEEYLENHPNSRYRHYEIAPLCEFAKLGNGRVVEVIPSDVAFKRDVVCGL